MCLFVPCVLAERVMVALMYNIGIFCNMESPLDFKTITLPIRNSGHITVIWIILEKGHRPLLLTGMKNIRGHSVFSWTLVYFLHTSSRPQPHPPPAPNHLFQVLVTFMYVRQGHLLAINGWKLSIIAHLTTKGKKINFINFSARTRKLMECYVLVFVCVLEHPCE